MLILCVTALIISALISFVLWGTFYLFLGVAMMYGLIFVVNLFGFWGAWFICVEIFILMLMIPAIFFMD